MASIKKGTVYHYKSVTICNGTCKGTVYHYENVVKGTRYRYKSVTKGIEGK